MPERWCFLDTDILSSFPIWNSITERTEWFSIYRTSVFTVAPVIIGWYLWLRPWPWALLLSETSLVTYFAPQRLLVSFPWINFRFSLLYRVWPLVLILSPFWHPWLCAEYLFRYISVLRRFSGRKESAFHIDGLIWVSKVNILIVIVLLQLKVVVHFELWSN